MKYVIKIIFTYFFFTFKNEATRKFKTTCVARIKFLLGSAGLEHLGHTDSGSALMCHVTLGKSHIWVLPKLLFGVTQPWKFQGGRVETLQTKSNPSSQMVCLFASNCIPNQKVPLAGPPVPTRSRLSPLTLSSCDGGSLGVGVAGGGGR